MKIIRTHEMDPDSLSEFERDMVYNGLDCCVTLDVYDGLHPQLDPITANTYNFSKALQAPTLEMKVRGVLVDQARKAEVIDEYYEIMERVEANLLRIVYEGIGMESFNYRSTRDLASLFYDELGISPIRKSGKPTVSDADEDTKSVVFTATCIATQVTNPGGGNSPYYNTTTSTWWQYSDTLKAFEVS